MMMLSMNGMRQPRDQELVARDPAKHQHRDVRQQRPGRTAELRTRRDETTMSIRPRPFHRQQVPAAPFAADAHSLDEADDGQDDGAQMPTGS